MNFTELHHGDSPLILPNAWDVASALMFLDAGFLAIGTTSLGLAAGAGHIDGSRAVRELTRALAHALSPLPCPISVDLEDGFDESPHAVADFVQSLGVDGINIEDSTSGQLVHADIHTAKIAQVKAQCPEIFVNARVDTYWLGQTATVEDTLERARCYVDAGADGIFIPGTLSAAEISAFATAIPVPVNVLASTTQSARELMQLGVRRISTGSLPYRAALDAAVFVATSARDGGLVPTATSYSRMQVLVDEYARLDRDRLD